MSIFIYIIHLFFKVGDLVKIRGFPTTALIIGVPGEGLKIIGKVMRDILRSVVEFIYRNHGQNI